MQSTPLSTIIARMDRWKTAETSEERMKVKDIDMAIRMFRRNNKLPWNIKKGTLRVFEGVYQYPVQSDFDDIAYLDSAKEENRGADFRFTSLQEFMENRTSRNDLALIFEDGTPTYGVRYSDGNSSSVLIDDAEDYTKYSVSDDAILAAEETVICKEGSKSVKVTVVKSTNLATIENSFTGFSDTDYKKKYFFAWIYLSSVPTAIDLRIGNDSSNFLYQTLYYQFDGSPLEANNWNLIAFDLNYCGWAGTFDETSISYSGIVLYGASTGTYYIDSSYLRSWELMDCWYYSKYCIKTTGADLPTKAQFMDSNEEYTTTDELVGDEAWIDLITFTALDITLGEAENEKTKAQIYYLKSDALDSLIDKYPSMEQLLVTSRYNFTNDFNADIYGGD